MILGIVVESDSMKLFCRGRGLESSLAILMISLAIQSSIFSFAMYVTGRKATKVMAPGRKVVAKRKS
jgi:hypothetical protein